MLNCRCIAQQIIEESLAVDGLAVGQGLPWPFKVTAAQQMLM